MIYDFLTLLYLAAPAFIANMMPIVAAKINVCPRLAKPIDADKTWRDHAILGKNKTWRGLIIGTLSGSIIALIQYYLPFFESVKMESVTLALLFGGAAGFGALFGDAVASIIKRQSNVPSGKPFIPLDQIDYILGFILFTIPFVTWTFWDIILILAFALVMNPVTNLTAYLFGIKNTYW